MGKLWKVFVRVVRSYTIEEKVISIIVAGIVVFVLAQSIVDFFKAPNVFTQEGRSYSESVVSDRPVTINPLFADYTETNRDLAALVFSGLSKYDPAKKAFVDDMAVLTITPDRLTYHFVLKNDLKWHDGQPVTADDVFFTFHDLIQNAGFQNPVLKVNFQGIEIKEVDQQTIEFKLKSPNAFFITNMNVGILPKHILETVPVEQLPASSFNAKPVGTGPYKVDSPLEMLDDGRENLTLKIFEGYYGARPQINQIRFNIYPDYESLVNAIGTANIVSKLPTFSMQQVQAENRFSFLNYELPQYTAVFFNVEQPVMKKDKVRVGLLKALDKQALLKLFNDKVAVDTPLLELDQQEWIYQPNLKEAQGALYDAGYKLDKTRTDGIRIDSAAKPLKLSLLARWYDEGTPQAVETKQVTDFLKAQWLQLGVDVDVQMVDSDTYLQRLQARDYDMVLAGQSLGYNLDTYSYWHSSQANPNGLNLSNYKSFAADQLIEKIRDIFDSVEKDKKLKQLAKVLADDVPAVFLYRPVYNLATDGKVKGLSLENMDFPSDRFAHIESWCVICQ